MRIKFSPQGRLDGEKIVYKFSENLVTATYKGVTDSFDFSGLPDGKLDVYDMDTKQSLIETELEVIPIMNATKENGVLSVELLNFIGADATEEERFPQWFDSEDA